MEISIGLSKMTLTIIIADALYFQKPTNIHVIVCVKFVVVFVCILSCIFLSHDFCFIAQPHRALNTYISRQKGNLACSLQNQHIFSVNINYLGYFHPFSE